MKEYIERKAAIEMFDGIPSLGVTIKMMIDSIPAADVTPVVHGEWVSIPSPVLTFRCGNIDCARKIPFGCLPDELKFCPFCGARMDGGKRDGCSNL